MDHDFGEADRMTGASILAFPDWDDPDVQFVYALLCAEEYPGKPEDDHWEGWVSRLIVARLRERMGQHDRS
jgi:hypothetical protein